MGAVGFLLSIAFLFLGAPDIAITQIVVEILCLVILIRATISRDLDDRSPATASSSRLMATVAVVLVLAGAGRRGCSPTSPRSASRSWTALPTRRRTSTCETGLAETGAANIVTAVLLDFRAYDTLGEATVLFCAILGAADRPAPEGPASRRREPTRRTDAA